jgi:hypothetical protein
MLNRSLVTARDKKFGKIEIGLIALPRRAHRRVAARAAPGSAMTRGQRRRPDASGANIIGGWTLRTG